MQDPIPDSKRAKYKALSPMKHRHCMAPVI